MQRRLRILWSSNSPHMGFGYSTQTALIAGRLRDAGFPIAINAFAGQVGHVGEWEGIKLFPVQRHAFGSDGLWFHGNIWQADIAIPFHDIHTLHPGDLQKLNQMGIKLVPYLPIDREPVPPGVLQNLKFAWRIITYAKFGQRELMRQGFVSECIPHGVDLKIYKPLGEKEKYKRMLNMPEDHFLFGMIAANKENPPRKGFQEALDAFKIFLINHPKSMMYLHVWADQPGGFNIPHYVKFLGIENNVKWYDDMKKNFINDEKMNEIYNALDCLLMPSVSEGFGLPAIEAPAAGVPIIVNDFSALSELVIDGKTGFKAKPLYKRFGPQMAYEGVASTEEFYKKMIKMVETDREAMSKAAREHVAKNYDINMIVDKMWIPYLEKLELVIHGPMTKKQTSQHPIEGALEKTQEKFGEQAVKIIK